MKNLFQKNIGTYYVDLLDEKTKKEFEAHLVGKNSKKIELHKKEEVDLILKDLEKARYIVEDIKKGEKKRTSGTTIYNKYNATRGFKKT